MFVFIVVVYVDFVYVKYGKYVMVFVNVKVLDNFKIYLWIRRLFIGCMLGENVCKLFLG